MELGTIHYPLRVWIHLRLLMGSGARRATDGASVLDGEVVDD